MGEIFAIYALASCSFLRGLVAIAILSLAATAALLPNIDFVLNVLDFEPNVFTDYVVLLYQYIQDNFFLIALIVFILTIISFLYVRYRIIGAVFVGLAFLLFYAGSAFIFVLHLIFE